MTAPADRQPNRAPGPDPEAVAALVWLCTADTDDPPDWVIDWLRGGAWAAVMCVEDLPAAFGLKGTDGHRDGVSAAREQVALTHLHAAAEILAPGGDPDEQARAVSNALEFIRSGNHKDIDDRVLRLLSTADRLRGIPATPKNVAKLLKRT